MSQQKHRQHSPPSSQSGFTIIESLMAIIVVSILMIGLGPIITLAVANRVQARRVELATQAARSYINDVRQGTVDSDKHRAIMVTDKDFTDNDAPNPGNLNCDAGKYCTSPASDLYCIDGGDEDQECTTGSLNDMIVQAMGYPNVNLVNKGYRSYKLGVRVYRADAFGHSTPFTYSGKKGDDRKTQSTSTGGTGLRTDEQPPLFETTTEIVVDDPEEFQQLCDEANVTC